MLWPSALVLLLCGCWRGSPEPGEPSRTDEPIVVRPRTDRGALILRDRQRVTFAGDAHEHTRICVTDEARIDVEGSAELVLTSDDTTVITGRGIGARSNKPVNIRIVARGAPEIFVLFDNVVAKVTAELDAPQSKVHVAITGKAGLVLNGKAATVAHYAGWGLPETFPRCR